MQVDNLHADGASNARRTSAKRALTRALVRMSGQMSQQTRLSTCRMASPVGTLTLWADGEALTSLEFTPDMTADTAWPSDLLLREAARQLRQYFARQRTTFDLPLRPAGTDFQRLVWDQLRQIPYGTTISYGELARRVGNPKASRAVGLANGKNPIAVIIPCHRVIGADGSLTGFGGGLVCKQTLLELEQAGAAGGLFEAVEVKWAQAAGT
jgi:methylated-DNA-[protein]-cysteine S-methyltransferase